MSNKISFWAKDDKCITVNGLQVHSVDSTIVEIYIQSIARQAIQKGAYCVSISDDFGNWIEIIL